MKTVETSAIADPMAERRCVEGILADVSAARSFFPARGSASQVLQKLPKGTFQH